MTTVDMIKNLAQRNGTVNSADVLHVFAELDETKAQLTQVRQHAETATQCMKENVQAVFLIRQALEETMGCTAYLPASEYSGPTPAHDAKYIADAIGEMRRKLDAGEDRIAELETLPDGFKLVPIEPTEKMLAAAQRNHGLSSTAEGIYWSMLAAAPEVMPK